MYQFLFQCPANFWQFQNVGRFVRKQSDGVVELQ
jgi:hypothetical protein